MAGTSAMMITNGDTTMTAVLTSATLSSNPGIMPETTTSVCPQTLPRGSNRGPGHMGRPFHTQSLSSLTRMVSDNALPFERTGSHYYRRMPGFGGGSRGHLFHHRPAPFYRGRSHTYKLGSCRPVGGHFHQQKVIHHHPRMPVMMPSPRMIYHGSQPQGFGHSVPPDGIGGLGSYSPPNSEGFGLRRLCHPTVPLPSESAGSSEGPGVLAQHEINTGYGMNPISAGTTETSSGTEIRVGGGTEIHVGGDAEVDSVSVGYETRISLGAGMSSESSDAGVSSDPETSSGTVLSLGAETSSNAGTSSGARMSSTSSEAVISSDDRESHCFQNLDHPGLLSESDEATIQSRKQRIDVIVKDVKSIFKDRVYQLNLSQLNEIERKAVSAPNSNGKL